jgi:anaerobic selenocysteine-containing dehydrogenase
MNRQSETEKIKTYCGLCSCWCPVIAQVRNGVFVALEPDEEHPLACGVCRKALAAPELVYSKQRLQYPMRRTRPKGDPDPGWERITWNEALDTIGAKLNEIKAKFGPEAVAVTRCSPGGSPMTEVWHWINRFAHAFGTPNNIFPTNICQWHRDRCSAYTYGNIGGSPSQGRAEFERAACILIWGNNIHATRHALLPHIEGGLEGGAKLIVIDPRKTEIAAMADIWMQVSPGSDGALALSMINVMIEENLYDHAFVRDWTTAPFLIRSDTGDFLKASDLTGQGELSSYVIVDSASKKPRAYVPGTVMSTEPVLDGTYALRLTSGEQIECNTAFKLLRESTSEYTPDRAEALVGVSEDKIKEAVRMFATSKPSCWYSWNGIEQNKNASQTNRAICILYALTGNYDTPGGNVILPKTPNNPIDGYEFLTPEADKKRLGFKERPLGPSGITIRQTQDYEVWKAILTGKPYPVKALLSFGGNPITNGASGLVAKQALSQIEFHAVSELFLSPAAELADIVLPAASSWESWHVGINVYPFGDKAHVQLRPAVVPPQHESWPDLKIIFELAKRLGVGDKLWGGNMEAAFDYQFAPANITVEQLRMNPGGIPIDLSMEYEKYSKKDEAGNFIGFPTPSKRVELYSSLFKEHGYDPLPSWKEPFASRSIKANPGQEYPLILTGGKVEEYCHGQQRALPSLRRRVPHPFLEINTLKARELGVKDKEWVILETANGSITLQAKLTEGIPYNVVCTQNGWWQACPELNLPGYDPCSPKGANVSLLHNTEEIDIISGSLALKGYPCNVRRA